MNIVMIEIPQPAITKSFNFLWSSSKVFLPMKKVDLTQAMETFPSLSNLSPEEHIIVVISKLQIIKGEKVVFKDLSVMFLYQIALDGLYHM